MNTHHVGVPFHEFLAGGLRRVLRNHVFCILWLGCCSALDHRASSCPPCGPVLWASSCHPHPVYRAYQRWPHQPRCHLRLPYWLTDVSFPCRFLHRRSVPGCRCWGCCAVWGHTCQHERQLGHEHGKGPVWMFAEHFGVTLKGFFFLDRFKLLLQHVKQQETKCYKFLIRCFCTLFFSSCSLASVWVWRPLWRFSSPCSLWCASSLSLMRGETDAWDLLPSPSASPLPLDISWG